MKKAQIVGQIFIYIMAIIVVGMIVILGYWAVKNIMEKSCKVEQLTFKTNIDRILSSDSSFGSVQKEIIPAPCGYDTICFVDSFVTNRNAFQCVMGPPLNTPFGLVTDAIRGNSNDTIFLGNKNAMIGIGNFVKIKIVRNLPTILADKTCVCVKARNNNFYLTFRGNGATATIEPTP